MKRMIAALLLVLLCGCSARGDVAADQAQPVESEPLQQGTGYVALTFDDGPSAHTERLLQGLEERGVHATFFLLGSRLVGKEALVRRMRAEGHQIGNHTHDHAQLTALSTQAALEDLAQCDLALCTLLGEGDYWVRPPYGSVSDAVLGELDVPVIGWSVDPRDWECQDAAQVLEHIAQYAGDGDIILLHDCYESTVDAALQAVDLLQSRGLQVVSVAELMELRGNTPQAGEIYNRIG